MSKPPKIPANWRTAKVSPDQYISGPTVHGEWYVMQESVSIGQYHSRAAAERAFREYYPGKPLYVYGREGVHGKWEGGQPPGTYSWQAIDKARKREEKRAKKNPVSPERKAYLKAQRARKKQQGHPDPKFRIGDRVCDLDGGRPGTVGHVGSYTAGWEPHVTARGGAGVFAYGGIPVEGSEGYWTYKVQQDNGGPRHTRNENNLRKLRKSEEAKSRKNPRLAPGVHAPSMVDMAAVRRHSDSAIERTARPVLAAIKKHAAHTEAVLDKAGYPKRGSTVYASILAPGGRPKFGVRQLAAAYDVARRQGANYVLTEVLQHGLGAKPAKGYTPDEVARKKKRNPAKTFQVGDHVRHTTAFRRSVGMYKGNVDGVVVDIAKGLKFPVVYWSEGNVSPINPANIEHVKSPVPGLASVVAEGKRKYEAKLAKEAAEEAAFWASPAGQAAMAKRGNPKR